MAHSYFALNSIQMLYYPFGFVIKYLYVTLSKEMFDLNESDSWLKKVLILRIMIRNCILFYHLSFIVYCLCERSKLLNHLKSESNKNIL